MLSDEETHTRFKMGKQAYWQMRDKLLQTHFGKWVSIVSGQVVAVGDSASEVIRQAVARTCSTVMYVKGVGFEDRILRVRRVVTGWFDPSYAPPAPMMTAEVTHLRETERRATHPFRTGNLVRFEPFNSAL